MYHIYLILTFNFLNQQKKILTFNDIINYILNNSISYINCQKKKILTFNDIINYILNNTISYMNCQY